MVSARFASRQINAIRQGSIVIVQFSTWIAFFVLYSVVFHQILLRLAAVRMEQRSNAAAFEMVQRVKMMVTIQFLAAAASSSRYQSRS